jgi:hypothetical protein
MVSVPAAALAFLALGGNLFNGLNLTLWLGALSLMVWSLWLRDAGRPSIWRRLGSWISKPHWEIRFDGWTLLVLAAVALVAFFRLYNLQSAGKWQRSRRKALDAGHRRGQALLSRHRPGALRMPTLLVSRFRRRL